MIWALLGVAMAARPDIGGLYSYDDADVLESTDGPLGLVRVTYSVSGPNQTLLEDTDGDGVPDFAAEVAATAEAVLSTYDEAGFRAPLSEADMGLPALGGSEAFDFYLVDFAGVADGQFSTDTCAGGLCSGFMVMENDFAGYGYRSLTVAIRVLTSHELFHAVQAAYNGSEPSWMSEGTATWAEHLFDPASTDFLSLCDAYLADTGRSIDRPPAGAGSAFTYGTALFWAFLEEYLGEGSNVALQEAMVGRAEDDEALDAVEQVITDADSTLADVWATFATWNVATGRRAGLATSYSFAEDLGGVTPTASGESLAEDNRFYPLAASYFRLEHPGGPLIFSTSEDGSGLEFSLHAVADGQANGPVEEALSRWTLDGPETVALGELDAGTYWLVGSYPQRADQSEKILFCLGGEADQEACVAPDTGAPDDTGGTTDTGQPKDDGCGCQGVPGLPSGGAGLIALALLARRRRAS